MDHHAKFYPGTWLRNRNTHEEGFVKRAYGVGNVVMYEMSLPNKRGVHYVSDWNEKVLELAHSKARAAAG
jgi:hypothetical protein